MQCSLENTSLCLVPGKNMCLEFGVSLTYFHSSTQELSSPRGTERHAMKLAVTPVFSLLKSTGEA